MLIRDSDVLLIFQELDRLRRECAMLKEMLADVRTQMNAAISSADAMPNDRNPQANSEQRIHNLEIVAKANKQKA